MSNADMPVSLRIFITMEYLAILFRRLSSVSLDLVCLMFQLSRNALYHIFERWFLKDFLESKSKKRFNKVSVK